MVSLSAEPERSPAPARGTFFFMVLMLLLWLSAIALPADWRLAKSSLTQVIVFLAMSIAFARAAVGTDLKEVFVLRRLTGRGLGKVLLLGLLGSALAIAVGLLTEVLVAKAGGVVPEYYQGLREASFPVALLAVGVLPAICEEAAFRGYLLWSLRPLGRLGVILTAALFAAMHLSLLRFIPLFLLGLIFTIAVERTGSLIPGVLLHFLNNAIGLMLGFWFAPSGEALSTAVAGSAAGLVLLLAIVLALAAGVRDSVRRLNPADCRGLAAEQVSGSVVKEVGQSGMLGVALPLLPIAVLYAWAAVSEIRRTFYIP